MLDPQIPVNFKARVEATDAARTTARDVAKQNPAAPWLAEVDDQRRERFEIRHRNGPESVIGDREDFLPVSFLARGYAVSAAVAMVTVGGPQRAGGTGFLIGGGLFITNHHVLPDVDTTRASTIEFGYEFDAQGQRLASTRFALDPGTCFITDDQNSLDVTVVAVGPRLDGPGELASFGACTLSDANDKHAIGMALNIIQHPELLPKCIAIRNNLLTARDSQVLLYETDTKVGSSGSPVFNDSWEVVALHHWGEPHLARSVNGEPGLPTNVNEGVRISVIVKHLRSLMPSLPAPAAERLKIALDQPGPPPAMAFT